MWERFSYYGMRGLLLLYLVQHFLFGDEQASIIYGGYIALVYIMSIFGGVLSDRYLGQRKAVTYGAVLLVLGHFGMAFEGSGSQETLTVAGNDYVIEDVGRDDGRKLFIDYEGADRRLVFDSNQFLVVGDERFVPLNDEGEGDYIIEKTTRGLGQNLCAFVGLGCAGEAPFTAIEIEGQSYLVTERDVPVLDDDGQPTGKTEPAMFIEYGGNEVRAEEISETDILVLGTATDEKSPDVSNPIAVFADGTYDTTVEKQQLYVNILFLSLALIIAGV
ncbi:MAG: MFS transporter, partial [Pseudomonadota bacterium]